MSYHVYTTDEFYCLIQVNVVASTMLFIKMDMVMWVDSKIWSITLILQLVMT